MPDKSPTIAYLTSGAGGMFCGSCLHDNTLARALIRMGIDAQLIPTYTPIRTDEEDISGSRVFFGGVNVFLAQTVPLYRYLPTWMTDWLNRPALIRWATKRASATSATALGGLTVSMLRGMDGNQRRETEQLCQWLGDSVKPDIIVLSNVLIAGCVPLLKQRLRVPILATLQGDDIFLDSLPEPFRAQSIAELRRLVGDIDTFLLNSRDYAGLMGELLAIPPEKLRQVPLGIDVAGFPTPSETDVAQTDSASHPPTIGYLARLAPEKGFHVLIDAFIELHRRGRLPNARLRAAGWQGPQHLDYFAEQWRKLRAAGCDSRFEYVGSIDRRQKVEYLRGLDVFSVPTTYREPKGLYVLEALAAGVPVVQPRHGAFPELLAATGGGRLVAPDSPRELAEAWEALLLDRAARLALGRAGQVAVHARFSSDDMAAANWEVMQQFLRGRMEPPNHASAEASN